MANVSAGVAYVDVRLGSIEKLKKDMTTEIEKIGQELGKKLGDSVSKNTPTASGEELGQKLSQALSKGFIKDAGRDLGAGLRAAATGQLSTARALFADAGRNFMTGLRGGFESGFNKFAGSVQRLASMATSLSSSIGNAAVSGWSKFQNFGKALDSSAQKMGFLSFQIQNFGLIASAAFTAPTVAALGFASAIGIKTAAEIEQATNALTYLLPKGYDVEALLKRLQKIAIESPIFDTADLIQYSQVFTSAGVEISKTERFLRAFSNIALVTGVNTEKANLAVRAITQAFGKGKLQAEELNQQLGEAMPAVMRLLREELGVTQAELTNMVKEGEITGDELIAIFTKIGESEKFLKGAASGAETLNGVWQNFKETLQTQLGLFFLENSASIKKSIDQLGPSLQELIRIAGPAFLGLIDKFADFVKWLGRVVDWYKQLSPAQQSLVNKFLVFATVLGPIVLALGTFMGALAGIAAGIAAVATPVGGIILAVAALGAAIAAAVVWFKKFLDGNSEAAQKIKRWWDEVWNSAIKPLGERFKQLWEDIKAAFNQIKASLMTDTEAWKTWGTVIKTIFNSSVVTITAALKLVGGVLSGVIGFLGSFIKAVASIISGLIKLFTGLTDFLVGTFTGDWSRAWEGVKQIWNGLWDVIVGSLVNTIDAVWKLVKGLVTGVINYFKHLYNVLVGNSIVPDLVKAILSWFTRLVDRAKAIWQSLGSFISGFYSRYFAPVVNAIKNGANTVVNTFTNLRERIVSALSGLGSRMFSIGSSLIQGLINGIRNMAGRLYDVASSIASSVVSKVSKVFDIGSPSKVFYQIGEWNMKGLALGMEQNQPSASHVSDMIPSVAHDWGGPANPMFDANSDSGKLYIENYNANENVDPWRQAEDWYFLVSARGGVA